jgi:hypothetical protein
MDGDGDLDVLSASWHDGTIAWYGNTDGLGTFGEQNVITTEADRAESVFAADLDGDGDIDVLSAGGDRRIAWYENTDGLGMFGEQNVITSDAPRAKPIFAADLDGDGDTDVLSAGGDGRIAWHEKRVVGDVNDDGLFNSSDLVLVFQAGEYEDRAVHNPAFDEGDWNNDGDFDSSDLVFAFQAGRYTSAARTLEAEIAAAVDWLFAQYDDAEKSRAFVA